MWRSTIMDPDVQDAVPDRCPYSSGITEGHLYKSKLRCDMALLNKFYRLHIKYMLRAKISITPCLA